MKRSYILNVFLSPSKWKGTLLTALFALVVLAANAQVGVGTISPNASAQLDVTSTTKGLLIPRMTDTERTGIASPATGLLVYQTNGAAGFWYFDGTTWQPFMYGVAASPAGFTAALSSLTVNANSAITGYNQLYADGAGLNTAAGTYTVPATGRYRISATVNYTTTAAISVALGASVDPRIALRVNGTETLTGLFPILNVNVALVLTLRAILGSGTVVVAGDLPLNAGDVLDLQYVADGLTINLNLGGTGITNGIVWSVRKL
ncbi:hypothetical protein J2Y45_006220 [Dyadobacter sp. BE34]|uniref:C1q domain-containing protein n=1 Tax=Dyadobacter fermentans TaxID=94254 RepID=A0ABU1R6J0_9BACT|nr:MULTISPECIES: hypothetical protein [Dyadobacter]MDR6809006.1 hypothetical protein [Dyadobacter fermentans]MDR7046749.1 hypothetical protein [Dyadobacter sp. BE242]MDR7201063.1 hypothetical protein [Dyadobacter sp. BE34]MDR7219023.1 hypothetical protein [Dyadobacter sp. BE31]MDR7264767.1 hypothetical protein [Dyadobacter sp. BE32]